MTEISRRNLLAGGSLVLLGGLIGRDSPPFHGAQERKPYPSFPGFPDMEQVDGRPVRIFVDPKEVDDNLGSLVISKQNIPPQRKHITDQMRKRGYEQGFNEDSNSTFFREAAVIPPHVLNNLQQRIQPLDLLSPSGTQIEFFPFRNNPKSGSLIGGEPDDRTNSIKLKFHPDAPLSLKEITILAFHEKLHLVAPNVWGIPHPNLTSAYEEIIKDGKDVAERYKKQLTDNGKTETEIFNNIVERGNIFDEYPGFKALGPLANIVTESSYFGKVGHPGTDIQELWVSTLNVLYHFPNSFMLSVSALKQKDQQIINPAAKDSINLLRNSHDNPDKINALFSPKLLQFIEN